MQSRNPPGIAMRWRSNEALCIDKRGIESRGQGYLYFEEERRSWWPANPCPIPTSATSHPRPAEKMQAEPIKPLDLLSNCSSPRFSPFLSFWTETFFD